METNHLNLTAAQVMVRKIVLTAVIMVSTLFAAHADSTFPAPKTARIAVTAMGVLDGDMMFNMTYDNAAGDKISIALLDESGNRLYREVFTDKKISKTFKVPSDLGTLVLVITNSKDKITEKFEISPEQHYVENVRVTNVH